MSTFLNDLKYAFRMLRKNPGFTLVIVLVLSLGISVSVTLFGFVDWRLHPPSPFTDPDRIVHLSATSERSQEDALSYRDIRVLQEQLPSLSGLAIMSSVGAVLKKDGWSREYEAAEVSRNFFSVAQVRAHLGRVFSEGDGHEQSHQPTVVLSHRLWKSQFGSDPNIIGQSILLGNVNRTVLGIAPPWFHSIEGPEHVAIMDLWIPLNAWDEQENNTVEKQLVGRLKSEASLQTLKMETEAAFQRLALRNPETLTSLKPVVLTDYDYRGIAGYPASFQFIMGLAYTVLLIACLNVSGLLLAKADGRRTEMAVRQALGGSHAQLMRQLLTEGSLLALLALGGGLCVSSWFMSLMRSLLPADVATVYSIHCLNPRILIFALATTVIGMLLFESIPIWYTCRANWVPILKADPGHHSRRGRGQFGLPLLVVSQLALALVLTVCACHLLRSYLKASSIDLGFHKKNVLLAKHLQPNGPAEQQQAFFRDLVVHARSLSGVSHVGLGSGTPMGGERNRQQYLISLPGDKTSGDGHQDTIPGYIVDSGYFPTIGIPVIKGYNFPEQVGPSDFQQVIVNETFASRFWPDKDPIGRFIQLADSEDDRSAPEVAQVVGMVRDVRKRETTETPDPYLYVRLDQVFSDEMTLLVETQGSPHLLADPVRKIIQQLDTDMHVSPMTTLNEETKNLLRGRIADTKLLGSVSLIGMSLASIGLYGIVAFTVSRRTRELGIRMALGARSQDVMRTVMGQGVKLSLIGLGIGLVGSFIVSQIMRASLVDVASFDLVTFAGASVILIGTALFACYVPARRAARVDPMVALRYE